jgi:hypothetical protein
VVLLVVLQVPGEVLDALGEQRDLAFAPPVFFASPPWVLKISRLASLVTYHGACFASMDAAPLADPGGKCTAPLPDRFRADRVRS